MERRIAFLVCAALAVPLSALAEVNVNVQVGAPVVVPVPPPPPRVVVPAPPPVVVAGPSVVFEAPPLFLVPPKLGIYVGVDVPYDIFFVGSAYYLYYGNVWYRSGYYNGPWNPVEYRYLPPGLRKHRIESIRSFRDREYRVYYRHRDRYRGEYFRPERDLRERHRHEDRHDHDRGHDDHDRGRGRGHGHGRGDRD